MAKSFFTSASLIALAARGLAQLSPDASSVGVFGTDFLLCNNTFARANATGFFSFNPGVDQGRILGTASGSAANATWGVAITEDPSEPSDKGLQYSLLYSTGGANYSDDIGLGYDTCAFLVNPEALANNTILRGQSDDGSCLQTFDTSCVNALQRAGNMYASWIDSASPLPNSNLTSTSLPTVCDDIASLLNSNLPSECQIYFADNDKNWIVSGLCLTEYEKNGLSVLTNCTVNGTGADSFTSIGTVTINDDTLEFYDALAALVVPVLTIFMPTANTAVRNSLSNINTVTTCMHIDDIHDGSRVPPALPAPTPVNLPKQGLAGGAIAGIVIGSLLAVVLVVLGALLLFNCCGIRGKMGRKRAAKSQKEAEAGLTYSAKSMEQAHPAEVDAGGIGELSPYSSYWSPELPSPDRPWAELRGDTRRAELETKWNMVELPAQMPER